jgi:RNA polymerase sigma factor (sigma-70 family)
VLGQFQDAEDAAQAVFLTLAHKAASLCGRASLAGWLHRAAWHVALRAREAAAVRKTHEREKAAMTELSGNPEYQWDDLKPILDFEIDALPEKYRLPLILHYMQGQTKEETARLLGLKSGTVSTWLDRGRDMLRERLARRGLAITGAALVALLLNNATAVAWSEGAAQATVQAAVQIAAGDLTAGGAVSAQVAALTQGTLQAMAIAKIQFIAASAAAVLTVCTLVGLAGYQVFKPRPVPTAPTPVVAALDKLDPAAIPAAEEFPWQPEGLVAVAGEHFGRHTGAVNAVAFATDGKLAVSAGPNGHIRLWDAQARRHKHTIPAGSAVLAVALSKDGKRLACGTSAGGVIVWALDGPQPRRLLGFSVSNTPVHAVAFSPLDGQLAVGTDDGAVQTWDVAGKEPKNLAMLFAHELAVRSVAFAADGKLLASGSDDMTVRLWDMSTAEPKEKAALEGHTGPVRSVAFGGNGLLASGSDDGTVRLWGTLTSPVPTWHSFPAQVGKVCAVAFHSDGTTLAAGGTERRICLWQVGKSRTELPRLGVTLEGHAAAVLSLAFGGPEGKLLSGSADWTARLWPLQDFRPLERTGTVGHLGHVLAVAFAPDGKHMATSSRDGTIRVWNTDGEAPRELLVIKDQPEMTALAFAADGQSFYAVSLAGQGIVKQFGVADGRELRQFTPQLKNQGLCVALSPGGRQLLIGCRDRTLRLWDMADGKEVARLAGHDAIVTAVAFASDGRRALSGAGQASAKDGKTVYNDCTLRLWDLDEKKQLAIVGTQATPVTQCGFFPDGKRVYSGSGDRLIRQWDISGPAGRELDPLKNQRELAPAALSPDGKYLATWRPAGAVSVWKPALGQKCQEWNFPEHVTCIHFAADSRHLAIGFWTGAVSIVRLEPPGKP